MKSRPLIPVTLMTLLSCFSLVSCETTDPEAPTWVPPIPDSDPTPIDTAIRLRPGDSIELRVKEDRSLDGTYPVRARGDIIINPTLERIVVEGLTDKEAAAVIKRALEDGLLTKATVDVDIPYNPNRIPKETKPTESGNQVMIRLDGMVRNRGRHVVRGFQGRPPMAYQALVDAGGVINFANLKKGEILRMSEDGRYVKIPANMEAIKEGEAPDIPLMNNDIINIPVKGFGGR